MRCTYCNEPVVTPKGSNLRPFCSSACQEAWDGGKRMRVVPFYYLSIFSQMARGWNYGPDKAVSLAELLQELTDFCAKYPNAVLTKNRTIQVIREASAEEIAQDAQELAEKKRAAKQEQLEKTLKGTDRDLRTLLELVEKFDLNLPEEALQEVKEKVALQRKHIEAKL